MWSIASSSRAASACWPRRRRSRIRRRISLAASARPLSQALSSAPSSAGVDVYKRQDLERTEENGRITGADPDKIGPRAYERARDQLGTLGAGNHFIEVDVVDEVFDETAAAAMGLFPGQIVAQIHCGSRGFGHQVCTDYVARFQKVVHKYNIQLPDRELVCAPLSSPEGQDYLAAMKLSLIHI